MEAQFREELIKIKSEKKSLISSNKSLQIRVDELVKECDMNNK